MKTLRASGTRVQADVIVGRNEYGGDVTVTVTLPRKDPEVIQALSQLDALLRRRAFANLNEAVEESRVQARVSEKLAAERERLTKVAKANAEAKILTEKVYPLEQSLRTSNHRADSLQREHDRLRDENTRLRQQVQTSTEKEG